MFMATEDSVSSSVMLPQLQQLAGFAAPAKLPKISLDQQPTGCTMHLLWAPPQRRKYAAPQQLLLRRYSPSAAENADKLLSLPGLGSAVDLMEDLLGSG
ncbi:hypothetical protein D4764_19G0000880 [Takifugu flavidus]|uniref:Uncharacterized protein n=1 Tax=Takifugu flavidus TaxID=433684 RepID=A0A5C6NQ79_9TELE|nr:hypothetical protein D4764_19G0000880 [Takifugu flavidus]